MNIVTPEHVGFSSQRLQRIRPRMQRFVDDQQCAGIITLLARRGQIAHCECVGLMDIETNEPMRTNTIFRIYSMSKPITSVAMMLLYEEGAFRLSDPITKYIPEFQDTPVFGGPAKKGYHKVKRAGNITIQQLFTHTAGLSYGFDEDSFVDKLYREMYQELKLMNLNDHMINPDGPALAAIMPALAKLPLVHQPGSAWHYSFAIDVLGYLVELLSGERLDVFLQRRIFEPLQMVDTGFYIPEAKVARFAALYTPGETGGLKLVGTPTDNPFTKPQNFFSGGGGLVSTLSDYLRFGCMLLNKGELDGVRILGRKTVEFMTRNHLPDEVLHSSFAALHPGHGFGLGWKVVLNPAQSGILGSEGTFSWGGAARTDFWVDPQEELIGLFMTQLVGGTTPWLADDFKILAYQALVG